MALLLKEKQFVDPVCGMTVTRVSAAAKTCYNGIQILFCAQECKNSFDADPQKFTLTRAKGFWRRYLDRLNKATGGRPPVCH